MTHESPNKDISTNNINIHNQQKPASPTGGGKRSSLTAFASSAGDQELPNEESADFGGYLDPHNNFLKNSRAEYKEDANANAILIRSSCQTVLSPMERSIDNVMPQLRLSAAKNESNNSATTKKETPGSARTASSPGLLIDCGKAAVKKSIQSPLQAIQMLPQSVMGENIKGMKLDGHTLKDLHGLPRNLIVLNISNCQVVSLDGIANSCRNLKLLNAGFNAIRSLESIVDLPNLSELYVNNNNITKLNECGKIDRLRLLDVSSNPISNPDDIEDLSSAKYLQYLLIKETPLSMWSEFPLFMSTVSPKTQLLGSQAELYKHSNFTRIASFAFAVVASGIGTVAMSIELPVRASSTNMTPINERVKQTPKAHKKPIYEVESTACKMNESRVSRKALKKDISNIIEQVSSKECTIVSQRNITDSISKTKVFNNPIAAMMIAPPQGIANRNKSQGKKVFKKMIPISVPTSAKHIVPGYCNAFGTNQASTKSKFVQGNMCYTTKHKPASPKVADSAIKNKFQRAAVTTLMQKQMVPSKLRVVRKPSMEQQIWKTSNGPQDSNVKQSQNQQQPNLRELLKEVYQVIKKKRTEDNKVSVDTIVVVNTNPRIVQENITSKSSGGGNQRKAKPICIDLRPERKFYLKERSTNAP